jgi:hypothetical protein
MRGGVGGDCGENSTAVVVNDRLELARLEPWRGPGDDEVA